MSTNQLIRISNKINLSATALQPSTFIEYKDTVFRSIYQNKPLIAFFAVDKDSGLPIIKIKDIPGGDVAKYEHACVITGYNPNTDIVRITHWGGHYFTKLKDLYDSSQLLTEKRSKEKYYHYTQNEKNSNPAAKRKKWNLEKEFKMDQNIIDRRHNSGIREIREVRTHSTDMGFKGILIQFV